MTSDELRGNKELNRMDYEDEDEFYIEEDEQPSRTKHTGFCGAIAEVMKRPERKIFPSMDDILDN